MVSGESSLKERAARSIAGRLIDHGHQAFFAGGYVRDRLLYGTASGDIDIATSASPQQISSLFGRVRGVGEHFGVMLVIEEGIAFEVATFRTDVGTRDGRHPERVEFTDARHDALRRDFTINALFLDPAADTVIDYVGGREDLDAGVVRAVGRADRRFREDYLRLLRAVRFAAQLRFRIDDETWGALVACADGIRSISPERIFQELQRMLTGADPARAVELLHRSGLLGIVLPEVEATVGVEQPGEFHPEGDVFTHTVKALGLLNRRLPVCAWAVLLHDIGKPPTFRRADRIRFDNHNRVGASMAVAVLKRLRASSALIENVRACVDNHMNFMHVRNMRLSTLRRLLARPTFDDELELHRVDCGASHGDLDNYRFLCEKHREFAREGAKPRPLLRGRDLIGLGLKPGPIFGEILDAAYDLQLERSIRTREEALDAARRLARERAGGGDVSSEG